MIVTRFAPSPTGFLHLGHALSALTGWQAARAANGRFLLRIEDTDDARCRPEYEAAIFEDLAWLGLTWEEPVRRQSRHLADYAAALDRLQRLDVIYPCFCSRKEIAAEIAGADQAPHLIPGADGPIYPGTCRDLPPDERSRRIAGGESHALRLNAKKAATLTGALAWTELSPDGGVERIAVDPTYLGDAVLARKDRPTSYHLAVTVDDDRQGVTLITRGDDLKNATHLHRLLQALLGLRNPDYRHHRMLTDESGRRLSKRDGALALRALREAGKTAAEVRAMAGFPDWPSPDRPV